MKSPILTSLLAILSLGLFAQVGINTDGSCPDSSAMADENDTMKAEISMIKSVLGLEN